MSYGGIEIEDALHVKVLHGDLVFVRYICDTGKIIVFLKDQALVLDTNQIELVEDLVLCKIKRKITDCTASTTGTNRKRKTRLRRRITNSGKIC